MHIFPCYLIRVVIKIVVKLSCKKINVGTLVCVKVECSFFLSAS